MEGRLKITLRPLNEAEQHEFQCSAESDGELADVVKTIESTVDWSRRKYIEAGGRKCSPVLQRGFQLVEHF
jgi:hypothetical protein